MTGRHRTLTAIRTTAVAALACLSACSSSGSASTDAPVTKASAPTATTTVVVDGLDHPTQIADGPDGTLLIAQLAGDEGDRTGEVVAVDLAAGTQRTLIGNLDKPTGVMWDRGVLWIMVRRGLERAEWADAAADIGPVTTVLDDLPYNGRSEGTITLLDDGRFLYETSGNIVAGAVENDSGTLWAFDPSSNTSTVVASGIKNGYAHALLDDGRIAVTDIGDNIADPPVEEIDVIPGSGPPPDLGWPACPGDADCTGVVRPMAVFPATATPTGVAVVGDNVYVTLFVTGELMHLSLADWTPGDEPVAADVVISDLGGPHTVLARPNGSLWISEYVTGRVVAIVASAASHSEDDVG